MIHIRDRANRKINEYFFNSDINDALKFAKTLISPVIKRHNVAGDLEAQQPGGN